MFSVSAFVHVRPSAHRSPSEIVVPWAHWLVGSSTTLQVVWKIVTEACSVPELESLVLETKAFLVLHSKIFLILS